MDLQDLDLSDRKTQLMLAGAAVATGLILAKLKGGGQPGAAAQIVVDPSSLPKGDGQVSDVGNFPPAPPIVITVPGSPPAGNTGGRTWVDPTGKPYHCPSGLKMAKESTGSGNDVCVDVSTGAESRVIMNDTGQPWQPTSGGGGTSGQLPYYCPAGTHLAKESTGSGNDVCVDANGRETRVIMRDTGNPWGVGGAMPGAAGLHGLVQLGGFSPFPEPINATQEITLGPGDSLQSVAARHLGHRSQWRRIVQANPQLVGQTELRAGQKIRLP